MVVGTAALSYIEASLQASRGANGPARENQTSIMSKGMLHTGDSLGERWLRGYTHNTVSNNAALEKT